jgi:hypothetical protein
MHFAHRWIALLSAAAVMSLTAVTIPVSARADGDTIARYRSELLVGFRGSQKLVTGPSAITGVSFNRAAQVFFGTDPGTGENIFAAVGTARGIGTVGGDLLNCDDDYSSGFGGYTDGWRVGTGYFCEDLTAHIYRPPDNPAWRIEYDPICGASKWYLKIGNASRCYGGLPGTAINAKGMEEIAGTTTDVNLDTKYTDLMKRLPGLSTWQAWGTGIEQMSPSTYHTEHISNQAFNIWQNLKDW